MLVVDDNPAIHRDFEKILGGDLQKDAELDDLEATLFGEGASSRAEDGFSVTTALQGQEGLERVKEAFGLGQPYSIAFVDMRMPPGWNGVETAGELWKVDNSIQLVICTAFSDFSWSEVVSTLGDADNLHLLRKPFRPEQVRRLATVLASKWARLRRAPRSA